MLGSCGGGVEQVSLEGLPLPAAANRQDGKVGTRATILLHGVGAGYVSERTMMSLQQRNVKPCEIPLLKLWLG